MQTIEYLDMSDGVFKYDRMSREYELINYLNNAIRRYPQYAGLVQLTDVREEMAFVKKQAAIAHHEEGRRLLQLNSKQHARNAYFQFLDANTFVQGFVPAAAQAAPTSAPATEQAAPIQLPTVVGEESFVDVKLSQMRKVIARRLGESKFAAPHFYLTMEINMDKAIEARKSMNEVSPVKISYNDMVIKAAAVALRKHPGVNSSWLEDRIRTNHHVHIGVAVAVEEGLLVPVVKFADNKQLSHISAEVKDLGGKAKSKKLQPQEMEGNTFTISNLGMFGIEEFTAIINPPDACIMAVGGIKQTAIVKDGQLAIGNIMKVTMSCDHRVVDGAVGSAFLQTFKSLLEDPVRILV